MRSTTQRVRPSPLPWGRPRFASWLAIPRRAYTQSHIDYVIEAFTELVDRRAEIPGIRIVEQPPALRHFSAVFAPVPGESASASRGRLRLRDAGACESGRHHA